MDPFTVIDPFLHDLVLQHFKTSEVLQVLSLVSPEWSQMTGKSRTCMNKVKFVYQVWRHQFYSSKEIFQYAQNSWRDYQHVIVELGVNDNSQEFWRFMESCSRSIRSLKLENMRKSANEDFAIDFRNMETFTAFGNDNETLKAVLESTTKLKSFFIFSSEASMDCELLIESLQRNRRLQDLYLKNVNFVRIFEKDFPVAFSLKSLKLLNTSATNSISREIEENLLKFIKQQSASLQTFFFEFESDKIADFAFNHLPALTSIGLLKCPAGEMKPNVRITNLEIPHIEEYSMIKKCVDAMPNVENLLVGTVTNELVDHLAWNFMKLESLNFKMISLDAEEHYEQLKSEHPEVNQNIDIWDHETVDWD